MFDNIIDLGDGHTIESGNMISEETGLLLDPRNHPLHRSESCGGAMCKMHTTAMSAVFDLIRHTFRWGINPLPVLRGKFSGFEWKFVPYFPTPGLVEMDWDGVRRAIRGADLVWCADASGVVIAIYKAAGSKGKKDKPLVVAFKKDPFFSTELADVSTLSVEVTPGEAVCVIQ